MVAPLEKTTTSDGSDGPSLSDDLLIEILTKLPLISLLRCKRVSKAWHQLIAQDCVQKRQPVIISGVYYLCGGSGANREPRYGSTIDGGFRGHDLGFFPFHPGSILVDSCNGLLLFYSCHPSTLYVCNPMTKDWVSLPKPGKRIQLSVLAFDPYSSPHYKVVSFTGWRAQGLELEVYSSDTGMWVEREVQLGLHTDSMSATMSYFDGSLHVLAYPQHIVGIDLGTMRCRRIELPEPARREGFVGKSGGCLYYTNTEGGKVRVWMLKECSDSCKWVLKHCIRVPGGFNFLALHPSTEVAYFRAPGKLVAYDPRDGRLDVVCELRGEMESAYLMKIWLFPFSQSISECLTNLG